MRELRMRSKIMINKDKKLYRIEAICSNDNCGAFLMGSDEKPHFTAEEVHQNWIGLVTSAPLNAPRCPKCKYATDRDFNAGISFLIDDGHEKMPSKLWFQANHA